MAVDVGEVLNQVKSFLQAQGRIRHVQLGEPKAPPQSAITAAVMMDRIRTPETVLDAATRTYEVQVRLYRGGLADGEATELELAEVVTAILTLLDDDADLGGNIRAVDVAGIHGAGVEIDWGFVEIDDVSYRTVEMSLPLIVDGDAGSLRN